MFMRRSSKRPTYILVATPSGTTGRGGVDRVMAQLRSQLELNTDRAFNVQYSPTRGDGSILLSPFLVLGFCWRMTWARLRGHLDVVHINLASDGSTFRKLLIALYARLLQVPYVVHLHGGEYPRFWQGTNRVLRAMIRAMFENAARIIVLGQVWRSFVSDIVPAASDQISIIPNAVPVPRVTAEKRSNVVHILFLGRLSAAKGVPQLLDALTALGGSRSWRATIAGDGDVDGTRKTVAERGLADRISVPGWVGGDQVAHLLATADVLVLPSFAENLPLSIIEAMAAGLAVVATPVGAVSDIIIDDETGLLVPPGDVEALSAALARLIADEPLRTRLGSAARALHREKLDVVPFADAITKTWLDAANGHQKVHQAHLSR